VSDDAPLLMIPGPTPLSEQVRSALSEQVRSHTGPENARSMRRAQEMLGGLFGSCQALIYLLPGSGTLAMEAAIVNHARPGQRMVVLSHGYFSDRFEEIGKSAGLSVTRIASAWGSHLDPDEVRAGLRSGDRPAVVTLTQVETSTGVLADCATLASLIRAEVPDSTIVVDGVCATGGVTQAMDVWGVDVVLTGSQKALSAPPGLAILALSQRAVAIRESIDGVRAYYADLARWTPSMRDPVVYFATHATGLLRALEVSLDAITREGFESRFARHIRLADTLRRGMTELGFTLLTDPGHVAPTVSVFAAPERCADRNVGARMLERGVLVAGCLGPWAGRGIRVGHMGTVSDDAIQRTLDAAAYAVN
jgi:alanine-glyoxylate transaminase/serine-glyoxylate transaminase/serine-pyruvate transaminase